MALKWTLFAFNDANNKAILVVCIFFLSLVFCVVLCSVLLAFSKSRNSNKKGRFVHFVAAKGLVNGDPKTICCISFSFLIFSPKALV